MSTWPHPPHGLTPTTTACAASTATSSPCGPSLRRSGAPSPSCSAACRNSACTPTAPAAATQAAVLDAKARRAVLELTLLDDAERLRAQVWKPHRYWDWGGKDHDFDEITADEPTPTDKMKLMQAASTALDRSLKIAVHDAGAQAEGVRSLLGELGKALGIDDAAGEPPPVP